MSEALTDVEPLLDDRFRPLRVLGKGRFGTTWLVEHVETGERYAIKRLSVARAMAISSLDLDALGKTRWEKCVELFRREAEVLQQIDHPGIPDYVDFFTIESAGESGQQHFSNVRKPNAVQNEIYRQMEAFEQSRRQPVVTQPAEESIPDQIAKLARLRDEGVLTQDEFEAKKQDLLGRM